MQLTREQAIAEHRKMWNWIAEQIERKMKYLSISGLKDKYYFMLEKTWTVEKCYLCQYANEQYTSSPCDHCPVEKPDGVGCLGGLYYAVNRAETWQEQASLARQIANLPERTDA